MSDNNTSERKPLILIAEDVESNYKLLEIILKKEYDLLWAKNGKEAVEYAFAEHPDAVLMDIKMPVMDGIEALKEIRLRTTELPVTEVCLESGFNNLGHFMKEFKKATQFTPLQFRRQSMTETFPDNKHSL